MIFYLMVVSIYNEKMYILSYVKNEDGSYMVDLKILEPLTTESIFTLSLKTDTRHNATVACKKWRELAANIYEYVYNKINSKSNILIKK